MHETIWKERKENILAFLESKEYRPMKAKNLRTLLGIPREDRILFDTCIKEMLQEGLCYQKKDETIVALKDTKMKKGVFTKNVKGFGFITPDEEGEDIFIPASKTHNAMEGDTVLYIVHQKAINGKKSDGVIVEILNHNIERLVGVYEKSRNFGFVVPDNKKIDRDIFISKNHRKGAVSGHKVVVEILNYGEDGKKPEGKIIEILGHINDPGVDILSVIYEYNLNIEFPKEVYQETEKVPEVVAKEDYKGRENFKDNLIITIDGADAKDLDDAVMLQMLPNGNYELGVHIADVSHYVKEHSPLDKEAYQRGTSVYLVDRVIPMLPHKLSNGICSLNPHVDRLTMSCIMEIDAKGNVVDNRICESVIHSKYRMTYDNVRAILEDDNEALLKEYAEIVPMLNQMNELRTILAEKRRKRGSIDFDLSESKIILDKMGKPIDVYAYERSSATNLIEEFMLICNETVAEYAYWQEMPFVYRSHMNPDEMKMERMEQFIRGFGYHVRKKDGEIHPRELQRILMTVEGTDEEKIITRMILRSMMQARYTSDNGGHFGLAAKYYTHFTSPIRRYPDLQIHRLLKMLMHGRLTKEKTLKYHEKLTDVAMKCSKRERVAEEAERATITLKKVEYMEDRIGEKYWGMISGVTSWSIFVELENTIEGAVLLAKMSGDYYEFDETKMQIIGKKTGKTYCLGDKVHVKVVDTCKEMGTIDFAFIEE